MRLGVGALVLLGVWSVVALGMSFVALGAAVALGALGAVVAFVALCALGYV